MENTAEQFVVTIKRPGEERELSETFDCIDISYPLLCKYTYRNRL